MLVALAAMWVYALFLAPKEFRLAVGDDAWIEQAEAVCSGYRERIDALPAAAEFADVEPLAEALRQRAAVLDDANALVGAQITDLRRLEPPDNDRGRTLVDRWLADWDLYLADREEQGDRWRAGIDDPITVVADDSGAPITGFMDAFATGNRMPSCQVPGDV